MANVVDASASTLAIGNGNGDVVNVFDGASSDTITVGSGNGDVVNNSHGFGNNTTVGNGNDTIYG